MSAERSGRSECRRLSRHLAEAGNSSLPKSRLAFPRSSFGVGPGKAANPARVPEPGPGRLLNRAAHGFGGTPFGACLIPTFGAGSVRFRVALAEACNWLA